MIDMLRKSIKQQYYLPQSGRDWELTDKLANTVKLRVPNRHSFGFSLDNQKNPPLAFFSANPPAHIAKMCDAIVALLCKGVLYFFIIEQKTGHKEDYQKQLANGKFFCQWLVSLYCHHGYCDADSVQYIGMLVWQPRQSPRKGGTAHQKPVSIRNPLFHKCFEEPNIQLIRLAHYTA